MLDVQDQADVEDLLDERVGQFAVDHVEEVRRVAEVVQRRDRVSALAHVLEGGEYGRHLGDEANGGLVVRLVVVGVARVEEAHGGNAGLERGHGMGGLGKELDEVEDRRFDGAMSGELRLERVELLSTRQIALKDEVGGLLEGAVLGEFLDGVAA